MAFIRRVRTGSGATAVQIAEYVSGRSATIAINGAEQTFPPQVPAEIKPVITALRG